jgi:hypothetical protein
MKLPNNKMLNQRDIPEKIDVNNLDVLLTIGAGDIDSLVAPIEEKLRRENAK